MKLNRLIKMEEYIKQHKRVSLNELTKQFNVSLNTVRRDVEQLAKQNIIHKVYGGVVYNQFDALSTFENRNSEYLSEKKSIGNFCASLIEQDDIIFIDSGTTTHHILEKIHPNISFTLITSSL